MSACPAKIKSDTIKFVPSSIYGYDIRPEYLVKYGDVILGIFLDNTDKPILSQTIRSEKTELLADENFITYLEDAGVRGDDLSTVYVFEPVKQLQLMQWQSNTFDHFKPNTAEKGLLMWHNIGSGKTCTAIRIAQEWMMAKKNVIWVTRPSLIDGVNEYIMCKSSCLHFGQDNPDKVLKNMRDNDFLKLCKKRTDDTYGDDYTRDYNYYGSEEHRPFLKDVYKYFPILSLHGHGWMGAYSYRMFELFLQGRSQTILNKNHRLIDNNHKLKNTLVIIDEAHLYIDPKSNTKQMNANSYPLIKTALNSEGTCNVLLLTATPLAKGINNLIKLTNLVRRNDIPLLDMHKEAEPYILDKYTNLLGKSISYVDITKYNEYFAQPVIQDIEVKLTGKEEIKNLTDCRNISCLERTNIINGLKYSTKNLFISDEFREEKLSFNIINKIKSSKLMHHLVTQINRTQLNEKHYIYVNFGQGGGGPMVATALQLLLDKHINILSIQNNQYSISDTLNNQEHDYKRIALLSNMALYKNKTISKPLTKNMLDEYNSDNNKDGKKIRIIILDKNRREGVNLYNVKHVHILDMMNFSNEHQAIGRAIRFCKHENLPTTINVYRYNTVFDDVASGNTQITIKSLKDKRDDDPIIQYLDSHEKYNYFIAKLIENSTDNQMILD
jgi:hypothetical protein